MGDSASREEAQAPPVATYGRHWLLHGNASTPGSFTLINRRLVEGLRARGRDVVWVPREDGAAAPIPAAPPSLYVYHGHPYDLYGAPGRVNAFVLNYEYFAERPRDRGLFAALRERFDAVVVPSRFVAGVLAAHGIASSVVPWGMDPREFHPDVVGIDVGDRFAFVYVGAANARKGFDLVLRAFDRAFTARDDVVLLLKESFRMRHMEPWVEQVARRHGLAVPHDETLRFDARGRRAPVVWSHGYDGSVAPWYAAAGCGLFPHRGEGFGMALLESMACGTPILATDGSGPDDFCTEAGAVMVPSRRVRRGGDELLEPDLDALCGAMRAALVRGRPSAGRRRDVSASVATFTWESTVSHLDRVLGRLDAGSPAHDAGEVTRGSAREARPGTVRGRRLAYVYSEAGLTSWRLLCRWTARGLQRRFPDAVMASRVDPPPRGRFEVVVGQAEACLEAFLRNGDDGLRILHFEGTALRTRLAIVNRERALCGVPPLEKPPLALWRAEQEERRAHHIVVASRVAASFFDRDALGPTPIHVVPQGMRAHRPLLRPRRPSLRYLFVATDPYRKGVRLLFQAWDALRLPRAELWVAAAGDVLQSAELLRLVTRNPSIRLIESLSPQAFGRLYAEIDWQVLPSLEDSFSLATGDGMGWGKPAIVSTTTGIVELLTPDVDGLVVESGSQSSLEAALRWTHDNPRRLRDMGEAAFATARRWPWQRYARTVAELVASLMASRA